ncbi:MAG: prepilin-type N-terminal cleavage/methylation domain-containing protein [Candidatus Omnitrophota bacterium]
MNKKFGFTLIELVVVIIVIGLLVTIALPRYQIQLEKGRAAEAYQMLGSIRDDAQVYLVKHGNLTGFDVEAELKQCNSGHYFFYRIVANRAGQNLAVAYRCSRNASGKQPNWPEEYKINIDLATGALSPLNIPGGAGGADGGLGAGGGGNAGGGHPQVGDRVDGASGSAGDDAVIVAWPADADPILDNDGNPGILFEYTDLVTGNREFCVDTDGDLVCDQAWGLGVIANAEAR